MPPVSRGPANPGSGARQAETPGDRAKAPGGKAGAAPGRATPPFNAPVASDPQGPTMRAVSPFVRLAIRARLPG